jgi:hypothetical protein
MPVVEMCVCRVCRARCWWEVEWWMGWGKAVVRERSVVMVRRRRVVGRIFGFVVVGLEGLESSSKKFREWLVIPSRGGLKC